jgi:hypothetical protein
MELTRDNLKSYGCFTDEQIDAIVNQANLNSEKVEFVTKVDYKQPLTPSDITTPTQLNEYAKGNIVRLPDFSEGQPLIVVLRRPSLLVLMKTGKIPNTLLNTASELFEGKSKASTAEPESISKMYDVMNIIAEASLVSPTFEEIKNAGIQLTDEQLIAIFNYSQRGVQGLQSFREE